MKRFKFTGRVFGISTFLHLRRNNRGSIVIFMAIGIIPLIGLAGLAFDAARIYSVKNRLQESLDSAGLAAAQATEATREDTAIRYFNSNYASFLESSLQEPTVTYDEPRRELRLKVQATVPTTFMRLFGFQDVTVEADTKIKRELTELEAALVLDVSTSMGVQGRINSLRQAATDFIEVLYGTKNNIPEIRVSIVPYAGTVKIGDGYKAWTQTQWENWKGCVHDRQGSPKGDETWRNGRFKTDFYHAQHPFYKWEEGKKRERRWTQLDKRRWSRRPNLAEQLVGLPIIIESNPHPHPAEEQKFCSSMEIKPLRSNRQALLRDLRNLNVTQQLGLGRPNSTGTRTDLGALWGWRTLSPDWRSQWRGSGKISNYHQDGVTKAVILMTDGANSANVSRNLRPNQSMVNNQMVQVCSQMKQQDGVVVYAIAFSITNSAIKQRLQQCASSKAHYFESVSRDTLRQAFQTIANQLSGLRVTQ